MLVYIPLLISALSSENILNGSSLSSLGATGDGMVSNEDIEVARSEERLWLHLRRLGRGTPLSHVNLDGRFTETYRSNRPQLYFCSPNSTESEPYLQ
jgi:hypothetical protein